MLSLEQQSIIENSIWVVNTALKKQGLQYDKDLKQSAILYMCECLERFDQSKKIKWSTYAYKTVFLYIKRTHAKEMKKCSFVVNDEISTLQLPNKTDDNLHGDMIIDSIKELCNPAEIKVLELRDYGYKIAEISKILGCSVSKINSYISTIKEKARKFNIVKSKKELGNE